MILKVNIMIVAAVCLGASSPAVARPTQEQCDAAAVMFSEAVEAVNVCGGFPQFFTNPTLVAVGKIATSCGATPTMWDLGNENFDHYVETLGAKQACAAFINALNASTTGTLNESKNQQWDGSLSRPPK